MTDDPDRTTRVDALPPPRAPDDDAWDRAVHWLAAHGALPALAVLTVVTGLVYLGVFRGEIAGDDLTFHFAESARLADCIRHGDWDLWNPSANAGFASAYYYQVLPQLASAIPTALFGHHLFWFQLSVFIPLVLAPVAAYRGMRLLGAVPWQALAAALVLTFTIGKSRWGFSADGTFSVGLYTQTWAFAALPLALGHTVRWAQHKRGFAAAIGWSAFVGLAHPFAVIALGITLLFGFLGQAVMHALGWAAAKLRGREPTPAGMGGMFVRLAVFTVLLCVALLPVLVPLLADYDGFGGFPHRVNDEVGPGFKELGQWFVKGWILDHDERRANLLTWMLPVVVLFARGRLLRWLWVPGLVFGLLLGMGPHMGKTGDDLLPAVRFLGAMQIVLGLGIGAGAYDILARLWRACDGGGARLHRLLRLDTPSITYGLRTAIAAGVGALIVGIAYPGALVQASRVRTLPEYTNTARPEILDIIAYLRTAPLGRKQVGPGCENHWWNLLSYVYGRIPSTLQMGGGGLQASPNYDALWTVRDAKKTAYLFDAPYYVFEKAKADTVPAGEQVFETARYAVRRYPTVGLVTPVEVTAILPAGRAAARKTSLDWARSEVALQGKVVAYAGSGGPTPPPQGTVLRAWRQDSPGELADLVADVDVTAPTTFVFRESWHPRWHAYIDGHEVAVRRVTPDFPAVDAPPGRHQLQLRFERPWWAQAAWLAWPGSMLLAGLIAWLVRRRDDRHAIPRARVVG